MYGGREEVCTGFWWGDTGESDHLKDLGVDRMIILKCRFKMCEWADVDWVGLAQDRDRWGEGHF